GAAGRGDLTAKPRGKPADTLHGGHRRARAVDRGEPRREAVRRATGEHPVRGGAPLRRVVQNLPPGRRVAGGGPRALRGTLRPQGGGAAPEGRCPPLLRDRQEPSKASEGPRPGRPAGAGRFPSPPPQSGARRAPARREPVRELTSEPRPRVDPSC